MENRSHVFDPTTHVVSGTDWRQPIFERDGFQCQYCEAGSSTDFDVWFTAHVGVDHVNPQSNKGLNDADNLVTCCQACNIAKGPYKATSFEDAKAFINKKREENRVWFEKHVAKVG